MSDISSNASWWALDWDLYQRLSSLIDEEAEHQGALERFLLSLPLKASAHDRFVVQTVPELPDFLRKPCSYPLEHLRVDPKKYAPLLSACVRMETAEHVAAMIEDWGLPGALERTQMLALMLMPPPKSVPQSTSGLTENQVRVLRTLGESQKLWAYPQLKGFLASLGLPGDRCSLRALAGL